MRIKLRDFNMATKCSPKYTLDARLTFTITTTNPEGKRTKRAEPVKVTEVWLCLDGTTEYEVLKLDGGGYISPVEEFMLKEDKDGD